MVIQKNINDITSLLSTGNSIYITVANSNIQLKSFCDNKKIELKTDVYKGENYIPQSVRSSVSGKSMLKDLNAFSYLTIDEENYMVYLSSTSNLELLSEKDFVNELEDFSFQAEKCRIYLDERDKDDLVYVHVK